MAKFSSLDRTDSEIIRLLSNDARLSNKQIASAIGLAPSSCHERLKRLRASGVLRGMHADVNLKALGFQLEALIQVELAMHVRGAVDDFVATIRKVPEVRQVFLVTGGFDLLVQVVIRDMEHLKNLAYDHFTSNKKVVRIETSVVFQSWTQRQLPIAK